MLKKITSIVFLLLLMSVTNAFAQEKKTNPPLRQSPAVPEAKAPVAVSYGIVVDNSGSFRPLLDTVIELVHNIVEENKPDDETFLVRFVDSAKTSIVQNFTHSKDAVHTEADSMFIEGGLTAILDAVNFSAKNLAEKAEKETNRRRVLILITDGEDRSSKAKIEDVLKFLKDEKIQVFTIGLADGKIYGKLLNRLSKETGGKSFALKTKAEVTTTVKEIAAAMRAQ